MAKHEAREHYTREHRGSDVFRALADPSRRKVLRLLSDRTLSAGEIAAHFAFTKPTLSRHLKVLREADLVATERKGTVIEYSANLSVLEDTLLGLLGGLGIGEPHGEET